MKKELSLVMILFILVFIISFVFAISPASDPPTTILNDTFNHTNTFTSGDDTGANKWYWTVGGDCLSSPYNGTFGYASTSSAINAECDIQRVEGIAGTKKYNMSVYNVTMDDIIRISFFISDPNDMDCFEFSLFDGFYNNLIHPVTLRWGEDTPLSECYSDATKANAVTVESYRPLYGDNCTFGVSPTAEYQHIEIVADYPNNLMDVYLDGNIQCQDMDIGGIPADLNIHGTYLSYGRYKDQYNDIFIDNLTISTLGNTSDYDGETLPSSTETCEYPLIFCDEFNYQTTFYTKTEYRWIPLDESLSIDNSFAPTDYTLFLFNDTPKYMRHFTDRFYGNYQIEENVYSNLFKHASQFSSEFDLNLSLGVLEYKATSTETGTGTVFDIEFRASGDNINISFMNHLGNYELLNISEFNVDDNVPIKIITSFSNSTRNLPFHSFINNDSVEIYANGILMGSVPFATAINVEYLDQYIFTSNAGTQATIDNYYVYVGTDKTSSTLGGTEEDVFIEDYDTFISFDEDSDDIAESVVSLYDTLGLKSTISRIIVALAMIFLVSLIILGSAIAKNAMNLGVIVGTIFVDIILITIFVYIKLLPIWIPVVMVIGIVASGALAIKTMAGNN